MLVLFVMVLGVMRLPSGLFEILQKRTYRYAMSAEICMSNISFMLKDELMFPTLRHRRVGDLRCE